MAACFWSRPIGVSSSAWGMLARIVSTRSTFLTAYHRQGIGKAMLARLLQALHERGIREARFDVVAVNAQAIAFYVAQGARPVGRCTNRDPRGDTEDLIFAIATAKAG